MMFWLRVLFYVEEHCCSADKPPSLQIPKTSLHAPDTFYAAVALLMKDRASGRSGSSDAEKYWRAADSQTEGLGRRTTTGPGPSAK